MKPVYTDDKNAQVLIALLKANNIKKVIASPGSTNVAMSKSMQNDSFFEMYSAVDERSAAYMACGLAAESGEPVVLSCTGATSSRNYFPGLTEAFYRKLPILVVTSSLSSSNIGHNIPQVTDRNSITADVVKQSFLMQNVKDEEDWKDCEIKANMAILALSHRGGGPVHINLETNNDYSFETNKLPSPRVIKRIIPNGQFPQFPSGKIAVFMGSHVKMNDKLISVIDQFCATNNAVVFVDHTSGYRGKYAVQHTLASSQRLAIFKEVRPELTIHLGEISGDYSVNSIIGKEVWRVSEDGEIRDTFGKLTNVFEMDEQTFFSHYTKNTSPSDEYLELCKMTISPILEKIPELPFSNIWIAKKIHQLLPKNSTIHFGILNSLRSWNFFELDESVDSASNVGGFGIDGNLSSLLGASLADKDKLYFGVFGDLAFFYDMNSMGNRHVNNNIRVLLVNNGVGTEFKNSNHAAHKFGDSADEFISARGHFGSQSRQLVKHYSEDLGFDYISASNKDEFEDVYLMFLNNKITDKPILFEVFTNDADESDALESLTTLEITTDAKVKQSIKNVVGQKNFDKLRKMIKK